MRSLAIVLTGSLLVLGASARAEDTAAPAACGIDGWHGGGHGGMWKQFDTDGDGQLSREEKAEAWKSGASEMRKKMFGELDTSADGKISADEIQTKMEQMRGKWEGHQAFGSKLTEEEKAAMKSISEKWIKEMVSKFDTDGDGQVAEEEVAAGMAAVREPCKKVDEPAEDATPILKLR
jgi:Ca2+-binding EF-hand superfamily protein